MFYPLEPVDGISRPIQILIRSPKDNQCTVQTLGMNQQIPESLLKFLCIFFFNKFYVLNFVLLWVLLNYFIDGAIDE